MADEQPVQEQIEEQSTLEWLETAIKLCEAEIKTIDRQLRAKRTRLDDLYTEICKEKFGVEAGVVVEASFRGKPYEQCRVDSVDVRFGSYSKPWLNVRRRKKNFLWSEVVQCAYESWRLITE